MNRYCFTADELKTDSTRIQECLETLQQEGRIANWQIRNSSQGPVADVQSGQWAAADLEAHIRKSGIEARFQQAPED